MSYGMPGFQYKGHYLIGYAAFKSHLSIFPTSLPIEMLPEELNNFVTSKGTIRFTVEHPLSEKIIIKLIELRKKQIDTIE